MGKRIMYALLSLVLIVSIMPTVAHAMSFPDVNSTSGYAAAVECVSDLKIMVGDNQGNFNPDKIVSRAEMAAIICRMLGTTGKSQSTVFTDVALNHWANANISKAAELGIVAGYGDGKFGPSDPVTYEQAITMVVRALGERNQAISYGGYPNGFIQVAKERFLLEGIPAVQGQGMSRGSIAILLYNYFKGTPAKPNDGHTHHYEERTLSVSGTGGHYEEVQIQVGTKTVNDYAQVTIYGCNACSFTTYDSDEMIRHVDARYAPITSKCWCSTWWWKTSTEVVGTHEEPVYATRTEWVAGSEITIRVCTLCGQMEP